jgi:hypothetical protein
MSDELEAQSPGTEDSEDDEPITLDVHDGVLGSTAD